MKDLWRVSCQPIVYVASRIVLCNFFREGLLLICTGEAVLPFGGRVVIRPGQFKRWCAANVFEVNVSGYPILGPGYVFRPSCSLFLSDVGGVRVVVCLLPFKQRVILGVRWNRARIYFAQSIQSVCGAVFCSAIFSDIFVGSWLTKLSGSRLGVQGEVSMGGLHTWFVLVPPGDFVPLSLLSYGPGFRA